MQKFKQRTLLITFLFSFALISCSEDESLNEEAVDLIVGEWLVVTENDYFCGTHDVAFDRATDPNQIKEFMEDGTWQKFEDGTSARTGRWENTGNGIYRIFYDDDQIWSTDEIEFIDNNDAMRFGIDDECYEGTSGTSYYTYTVWLRQ